MTTRIWGGCPPTLLGQEKPVPCAEQVQRTGSRTRRGREGADVHVSVGTAWHSMGTAWHRETHLWVLGTWQPYEPIPGPTVGGREVFQA